MNEYAIDKHTIINLYRFMLKGRYKWVKGRIEYTNGKDDFRYLSIYNDDRYCYLWKYFIK